MYSAVHGDAAWADRRALSVRRRRGHRPACRGVRHRRQRAREARTEARDARLRPVSAAAAAVRRRRRRRSVDRRISRRLQGVRLRHHLAAADARVPRQVARPGGRIRSACRKRSARAAGGAGVPQGRRPAEAGDHGSATECADRGLPGVRHQRAEPAAHGRRARRAPRRRHRLGASRRARAR